MGKQIQGLGDRMSAIGTATPKEGAWNYARSILFRVQRWERGQRGWYWSQ